MTTIKLHTTINASIEDTFDLSRDIDFHVRSAFSTNETAIDGKKTGVIGLGETVTWRGKHFGVYLTHTSKITQCTFPTQFTDEMIKGHFKEYIHHHYFKQENDRTIMTDVVIYGVPYGVFGQLFDRFFLKKHLKKFLEHRNIAIKDTLE